MITVESSISVHEEGTKFYQVFRIFGKAGGAVAVTHWGSYHKGADITPANHGSCRVEKYATVREASSKFNTMISGKKKRGYKDWEADITNCVRKDALMVVLRGIFGVSDSREILHHMADVIQNDDDMGDAVEPTASAPVIEPTTNERIERGELWAQW